MSEPQVTAPRPTWKLPFEWRHRNRYDVHGHRRTEVSALFSFNEADREDGLPNEIVIEHTAGESRRESTMRMSREAAEQLIVQLRAALDWNGKP